MKITCQSCQAKYTIADEKVAGKTVKIKCKKCGATIVVHGNEGAKPAASPPLEAPPTRQGEDEGEGETRVFADAPPGGGSGDEWTVNVTDDDQKTMTTAQIVADYAKGIVTQDTYVWKDGMGDWSPLSGVPELMALVGKPGRPAAAAPSGFDARAPAQAPPAVQGFGGTMMMDGAEAAQTPFAAAGAAPPAAAARRAGAKGGVDLFGAGSHAAEPAPPPAAAMRPPPDSSDRQVGERNENSVLFSLAALTATENAAKAKPRTSEDGGIGLRPSGGGGGDRNGRAGMERAGMDDIMSLGSGMSAAPILAPPPLLAPVVEAPVAPAMLAPVAPLGGPMAFSSMAPQKKSPVGLIVGIGAGLVVVAGAAFFFLRSSPPPPEPPKAEATVATRPSSVPTLVATAPAAPTAAPAAPPDTAVAAATSPTPTAVTPGAHTAPGPAPGPAVATTPRTPERGSPPPATPAPANPTPPPAATPAATAAADTGGNGRDFDRSAAMKALSAASAGARGCKTADGPTGSGKVKVTFAPSGNVTSATVQGPPYAGTSVGGCVASAFRGAHVPAFDGSPVSVSKSFNID